MTVAVLSFFSPSLSYNSLEDAAAGLKAIASLQGFTLVERKSPNDEQNAKQDVVSFRCATLGCEFFVTLRKSRKKQSPEAAASSEANQAEAQIPPEYKWYVSVACSCSSLELSRDSFVVRGIYTINESHRPVCRPPKSRERRPKGASGTSAAQSDSVYREVSVEASPEESDGEDVTDDEEDDRGEGPSYSQPNSSRPTRKATTTTKSPARKSARNQSYSNGSIEYSQARYPSRRTAVSASNGDVHINRDMSHHSWMWNNGHLRSPKHPYPAAYGEQQQWQFIPPQLSTRYHPQWTPNHQGSGGIFVNGADEQEDVRDEEDVDDPDPCGDNEFEDLQMPYIRSPSLEAPTAPLLPPQPEPPDRQEGGVTNAHSDAVSRNVSGQPHAVDISAGVDGSRSTLDANDFEPTNNAQTELENPAEGDQTDISLCFEDLMASLTTPTTAENANTRSSIVDSHSEALLTMDPRDLVQSGNTPLASLPLLTGLPDSLKAAMSAGLNGTALPNHHTPLSAGISPSHLHIRTDASTSGSTYFQNAFKAPAPGSDSVVVDDTFFFDANEFDAAMAAASTSDSSDDERQPTSSSLPPYQILPTHTHSDTPLTSVEPSSINGYTYAAAANRNAAVQEGSVDQPAGIPLPAKAGLPGSASRAKGKQNATALNKSMYEKALDLGAKADEHGIFDIYQIFTSYDAAEAAIMSNAAKDAMPFKINWRPTEQFPGVHGAGYACQRECGYEMHLSDDALGKWRVINVIGMHAASCFPSYKGKKNATVKKRIPKRNAAVSILCKEVAVRLTWAPAASG